MSTSVIRQVRGRSQETARTTRITGSSAVRLHPVREVATVAIAVFIYFFVRGLMHSKEDLAVANAHRLIDVERWLGIFREPQLQSWVTDRPALERVFNSIYIYGHWPVVIGTLVWLLIWHRQDFSLFRSALLISGGIGLVIFITFPMAPPRFIPELGFVDTVTLRTNAYRVLQPPAFTNQYAAMPSLHVGWNLLMGVAIVTHARTYLGRAFGYAMPVLMYLATVMTANHYFSDGVAGSIVALTGLGIAWQLRRRQRARDEARDMRGEDESDPTIAPAARPVAA